MHVLESDAIPAIEHFGPDYLVLAAGFDTYEKDPIGDFRFQTRDYLDLGARINALGLPTLIVQEGGYFTADLGANVVSLLHGFRIADSPPSSF
jgi:acetoin utilization deacetylase AcuC-like enzyme